nr:MAG TPA: hypothetical protein [Caudoviricetes sp.]
MVECWRPGRPCCDKSLERCFGEHERVGLPPKVCRNGFQLYVAYQIR